MSPVRYLDVVLLAIGAAVAIALGAPAVGYAIGAGTWLLQRVVQVADRRWIVGLAEPRKRLGYGLFEAFGRIWLLAGGIILAGAGFGRADGLTAALVIFGAYSVTFVIRVLGGPPQGNPAR